MNKSLTKIFFLSFVFFMWVNLVNICLFFSNAGVLANNKKYLLLFIIVFTLFMILTMASLFLLFNSRNFLNLNNKYESINIKVRILFFIIAVVILWIVSFALIYLLHKFSTFFDPLYSHSLINIFTIPISLTATGFFFSFPFHIKNIKTIKNLNKSNNTVKNKPLNFFFKEGRFKKFLGIFFLVISVFGSIFINFHTISFILLRILCLVFFSFLVGFGFKLLNNKNSLIYNSTFFLILFLTVYSIIQNYSVVNNSPLSSSWSEGSFLINASRFNSQKIYGYNLGLQGQMLARGLIQAVPFFISAQLPIWIHRLWLATLISFMPLIASLLLVRYLKIQSPNRIFITGLFYLFFLQGPFYFHFYIIPLLIILTDSDNIWKNIAFIILGSIIGGLERIQWFPLAGSISAILYILKTKQNSNFIKYSWKPLLYIVLGSLTAFITQYVVGHFLINNNAGSFFYFNEALLWNRLIPNVDLFLGVYPLLFFVTLGLTAYLLNLFISSIKILSKSRIFLISIILIAFLLGGLIVSSKIGGGNNLHNLDGFLFLIVFICGYSQYKRISFDGESIRGEGNPQWIQNIIVCTPLVFAIIFVYPKIIEFKFDIRNDITSVQNLSSEINLISKNRNQIIFISEGQLITFHYINDVILHPEYDSLYMQEMAMAKNQTYLSNFYSSLENHKFPIIVIGGVSSFIKDNSYSLSEENNNWVENIINPINKYYKIGYTDKFGNYLLLVPRN